MTVQILSIEMLSQPIAHLVVIESHQGREGYTVGNDGVTRIDIAWKPVPAPWWAFWRGGAGPVLMIPYIRVWRGDVCVGEWAQHRCQGVQFAVDQAEIDALIASDPSDMIERRRGAA